MQRPQPLKHFHRKHIPGIFGHDIRNQSINVLRAISPERMIVRAKTVPAVLAFAMRRLHLHPPQPGPAIHHKVIPVAIAPGLRHRKSQTRDFRQKRRLRNLPSPLPRNHRPPPLRLRPQTPNLGHQIPNHLTNAHHRHYLSLTTLSSQVRGWVPRFSPLLREVGDSTPTPDFTRWVSGSPRSWVSGSPTRGNKSRVRLASLFSLARILTPDTKTPSEPQTQKPPRTIPSEGANFSQCGYPLIIPNPEI
jgi:hypothetical protein